MEVLTGIAILMLVAIIAFMYYRQTEKFTVVGKSIEPIPDNKGMDFTQVPVDKTYVFADPIPDTATSFDRILGRFVDRHASPAVAQSTFPTPAPYSDSEMEHVAERVLARVKGPDTPTLDFISVEYAAKGVDAAKNIHYNLSIVCYDRIKNYSLKIVIVCVVDPKNKLWLKKFASFNSFVPDSKAPAGVASADELLPVDFVPDFTSYKSLYV
jgi:hypothetical protein